MANILSLPANTEDIVISEGMILNENDLGISNEDNNKEGENENNERVILDMTCLVDLVDASSKVIEENKKNTTYSYGGYSSYSGSVVESDYRTIHFYEFSDYNRSPQLFHKVSDFLAWCEKNGVLVSDYMKTALRSNQTSFCICRKGSANLCRFISYEAMKSSLGYDDYYKPTSCMGSSYPRRDEYYDDWD